MNAFYWLSVIHWVNSDDSYLLASNWNEAYSLLICLNTLCSNFAVTVIEQMNERTSKNSVCVCVFVCLCVCTQVSPVLRATCHLKCYAKTHTANQWMSGHVVSHSHCQHHHYNQHQLLWTCCVFVSIVM